MIFDLLSVLGYLAASQPAPVPAGAPPLVAAADIVGGATLAPGDDYGFLMRLGAMEGHLLVGRELLAAGQPRLALPHFGHPVRQIYDDLRRYLAAKGIAPFDTDLIELEARVASAPSGPATFAKYDAVIAIIHRARETAPRALRQSVPETVRLCSDTIEAAAGEYGDAIEQGRIGDIVEYHDSRGFLAYAALELARVGRGELAPSDRALLGRFKPVFARAQAMVAKLLPPPGPAPAVEDYRRIAAEAQAVARGAPAAR